MRIWKIYKHTNLINGKSYIGQTCKKDYKERWGKEGAAYKKSPCFYMAIQKYGWDNFSHELLEDNILTAEEANQREIYWINYYNTYFKAENSKGYNMTTGGQLDDYHHIPVNQYDLDGNLIRTWPSIKEAADFYERDGATINKCCLGYGSLKPSNGKHYTHKTACGYYWKYTFDNTPLPLKENKTDFVRKYILQYTLDDVFVKEWESAEEIHRQLNIDPSAVIKVCRHKRHKAGNFKWSYKTNE